YDFDPQKDKIEYERLKRIDRYILFRLEELKKEVTVSYENFEFHIVYRRIYNFCNEDLSMRYLDMVKGRLYTQSKDSLERRCAQTTIYYILDVLLRLLAPVLVFTCEEAYEHLPKLSSTSPSIHLCEWPKQNPLFAQEDIKKELSVIMDLIPEVTLLLENLRGEDRIGSSFDAEIILLTKDNFYYKYLEDLKEELREIFRVSRVEIENTEAKEAYISKNHPQIAILARPAQGKKCQRCWNYSLDVGEDKIYPSLCGRCIKIVRNI
ncbi:MAG: class I tRNA ligase family protein, partial [Candidatus Omnitrophica bacterium]|nr:class I tRNA ligase family protein [Candidatus Omnitrophota bacterium]